MSTDMILRIVQIVAYVVLGALVSYFKTNAKLNQSVGSYISEAENAYKDTVKAGGQKHAYVVEKLYELVPSYFKGIFTREMVGGIVDRAFDSIEQYGKLQLDKVIDKAIK